MDTEAGAEVTVDGEDIAVTADGAVGDEATADGAEAMEAGAEDGTAKH